MQCRSQKESRPNTRWFAEGTTSSSGRRPYAASAIGLSVDSGAAFTPDAYEPTPTRPLAAPPRRSRRQPQPLAPRRCQRRAEREGDHGDDSHSAEVARRQPARQRGGADQGEPEPIRLSRNGDQREHEQREHFEMRQRGVLGPREVPREDDEHEPAHVATRRLQRRYRARRYIEAPERTYPASVIRLYAATAPNSFVAR